MEPINRPETPATGQIAPSFALYDGHGRRVRLWDFRQRWNLVLILVRADARETYRLLLADLRAEEDELRLHAARLLVVAADTETASSLEPGDLGRVVVDDSGRVLDLYLGPPATGFQAGSYVLDRFGEIWAAELDRTGGAPPSAAGLLDWIQYVEAQCPECSVPEWPRADPGPA